MNLNIPRFPMPSAKRRAGLLLLMMVFIASNAYAEPQDIILSPCNNIDTTYAATPGQAIPLVPPDGPVDIEVSAGGNIFWGFAAGAGCTPSGTNTFQCAGMTVTHPPLDVSVSPAESKITITGTASNTLGASGSFTVTVTDANNTNVTCDGKYEMHVTEDGGGWGDPHMTTVEGVHYDFQSAGEFTALRQDRFEVQTRQTAVPTTTVGGTNEYTGLATCVSIYTAVAARIGSNRVSLQPSPSVESARGGLQLRVNGQLVTLTESGIDLRAGPGTGPVEGRIVRTGDAYQITDTRGTQLVVTPAFWDSQQKWYLNVNVYQTSATQGIFGVRPEGSWLPALPDGKSLGQKPESAKERYQQLYETFADAWRVTDATSLFDYAPGTNTATFTLDEWPRFTPQSCSLQGQTSAEPTTPEAAAEACKGVTDAAQKADCIFDVTVTGHTGFAQSYEAMQRFKPHGTGWQPVLAGSGPTPPPPPGGWPWWWWIVILIILLIIILLIVRRTV